MFFNWNGHPCDVYSLTPKEALEKTVVEKGGENESVVTATHAFLQVSDVSRNIRWYEIQALCQVHVPLKKNSTKTGGLPLFQATKW